MSSLTWSLRGLVRRSGDSWTVSLFVVNEQREPENRRDEAWVFQPELVVESPDGAAIFQRRPTITRNTLSDEEQAMAMLYRWHVGFAIGYGVSTHAETVPGEPTQAVRLSTRVVPRYDVARTEAPTPLELPGLARLVLDMKELAESPATELEYKLTPLATAYKAWIAEQAARIDDPAAGLTEYRHVAVQAIEECRRTLRRIRAGITLLKYNVQAAKAFAFMNRAMWQQRIHTLYTEVKRRGYESSLEAQDKPENRSWRPFQLAFILLNLPGLTDLHHSDRSAEASAVADLLWFPTGGGKTEAYLGLTAYTLAIRRLLGYFNSMNELGGMRRLVEDDVRSRLGRMEVRGLARRHPPILEELTSRRSSTDIPNILDKLERVFDPLTTGQPGTASPRPLDVLLATNMISVGVDVTLRCH